MMKYRSWGENAFRHGTGSTWLISFDSVLGNWRQHGVAHASGLDVAILQQVVGCWRAVKTRGNCIGMPASIGRLLCSQRQPGSSDIQAENQHCTHTNFAGAHAQLAPASVQPTRIRRTNRLLRLPRLMRSSSSRYVMSSSPAALAGALTGISPRILNSLNWTCKAAPGQQCVTKEVRPGSRRGGGGEIRQQVPAEGQEVETLK